jgi:micrococcal nuclease
MLILLAIPHTVNAAASDPIGAATAIRIIDGDTLALDDGRTVRLAGVMAPKAGASDPPALRALAAAALDTLTVLANGRRLQFEHFGRDRYDRWLIHAHNEAGQWLQGELLARGLARVATAPDQRSHAAEMLRLETMARDAMRGLWGERRFRVLGPDEVTPFVGSFQIVDGVIVAVGHARGRSYLNFGADWRTDFTVAIERRSLERLVGKASPGAAASPGERLVGRRVRVRGWIKSFNGPLIEANHPEQVELLDP